jgi:hypothetical protein
MVEQGNQASRLRRFTSFWPLVGLLLVLFTVFGGLVQAGEIAPKFELPSGGGIAGGTYLVSVRNLSWRSWTITGVNLAGGHPIRRLPDGSTVALGASYRGMPSVLLEYATEQHVAMPFTVGDGQWLTLTLVRSHAPNCKPVLPQTPKEMQRYNAAVDSLSIDVPVSISVGTPLGSRNITTTFNLIYGCP